MNYLKRFGIDGYMVLLLVMLGLGLLLPAKDTAAVVLHHATYWGVALLFFLYGAKLDPRAIKAGLLNWKLQGASFAATYALFPVFGLLFAALFGSLLGPNITLGILFLSALPSTVQSSVAFTGLAGGNIGGAICAASLSNMIGVVLTPILVAMMLNHGDGGVNVDAMLKIGLQILLPFVVGQILRPWIGQFVARHKSWTMVVDRGAILLIVYSAFSAGTVSGLWATISTQNLLILLGVVLVFLAVVMVAMVLLSRMIGLDYPDRAVIFYCGSTKSMASGLPIAASLFPAAAVGAIVLPIMIYHMLQLLVCAFVAQRAADRISAEQAQQA